MSFKADVMTLVHRLFLIYVQVNWILFSRLLEYFQSFLQFLSLSGTRSKSLGLPKAGESAKRPNHLLVILAGCEERKSNGWPEEFLRSCLQACDEYGISWLTLIDSVSGSSLILLELVKLAAFRPLNLYCNHKPINSALSSRHSGSLQINVVTENQRNFFIRELRKIAVEEPDFRFSPDNLLSKMTCFPEADLVVSTQERLSLKELLPSQIGFAEFCHIPKKPLNSETFDMAIQGFAQCKQNFGK